MDKEKRKPEGDEEIQEGQRRAKTREVRRLLEAPDPGVLAWQSVTPTRFVASRDGTRYTVYHDETRGWIAAKLQGGRPQFIARGVASLGEAQRAVEARQAINPPLEARRTAGGFGVGARVRIIKGRNAGREGIITQPYEGFPGAADIGWNVLLDSGGNKAEVEYNLELLVPATEADPMREVAPPVRTEDYEGRTITVHDKGGGQYYVGIEILDAVKTPADIFSDPSDSVDDALERAKMLIDQSPDLYPPWQGRASHRAREAMSVYSFGAGKGIGAGDLEAFAWWLREYYYGYVPTEDDLLGENTWQQLFQKYADEVGPSFRAKYAGVLGARRTREVSQHTSEYGIEKKGQVEQWMRQELSGDASSCQDAIGGVNLTQLGEQAAAQFNIYDPALGMTNDIPEWLFELAFDVADRMGMVESRRVHEVPQPGDIVWFKGQQVRLDGTKETFHRVVFWNGRYLTGHQKGKEVVIADEIIKRQPGHQIGVSESQRGHRKVKETTLRDYLTREQGLGAEGLQQFSDHFGIGLDEEEVVQMGQRWDDLWMEWVDYLNSIGESKRRSHEALTTTGQELWDLMVAQADPWAELIFTEYTVDDWLQFVHGFRGQIPFERMPQDVGTASADEIAQTLYEYAQNLKQAAGATEGSGRRETVAPTSVEAQRLFDVPLESEALVAAAVAVTDALLAELNGPFVVIQEQEIAKGRERAVPIVTVQSQTGEVFRLSLQEGRLHVDDVHETRGYDAVKKDGTVLETLPGRSMTAARQEVGRALRDERRDEYYDWEDDGSRVVPSSEPTLEEAFSWAGEITDLVIEGREQGIVGDEMVDALNDLAESLLKEEN